MNRPIKFRAWNKDKNNWADLGVDDRMSLNDNVNSWECLMQFTGLTDKNGKEIYEGDIYKSGNGRLWVVMLGEYNRHEPGGMVDGIGWYLKPIEDPIEDANTPIEFRPSKIGEVIGNIYENPELLK